MKTDIIVDLDHGDSAKGKASYLLAKEGKYSIVCRYSGSQNAGHTIYHNSEKYATHIVPAGVFFGIKSIIGPCCFLNVKGFFKEIEELEKKGIEASKHVKIASTAHIITDEHIKEEENETAIGTTRRGVGKAARDKFDRKGIRAESIKELEPYIIDMYEELYVNQKEEPIILCEGAQGHYLDVDWGDYPYCTSASVTASAALLNGFAIKSVRNIFGCQKAYNTYVGSKKFQPEGEIFKLIQEVGGEIGTTTGRKRQVNFLDVDRFVKASVLNGCTQIFIAKMDVLQKVNCWKVIEKGEALDLKDEESFKKILGK